MARRAARPNLHATMIPQDLDQRLSRITTQWTCVFQAHGGSSSIVPAARQVLVQRYHAVVYRYLLGAVKDPDVAEELCQEFALRMLRGDFHRADPERGRFRDYLKRALVHLVTDYHRGRQEWPRQMAENAPEPALLEEQWDAETEASYLESWREEVLNRVWHSLQKANPSYYQVLLFRIDHPDLSSAQMAEALAKTLGKEITGSWVRKTVERAQKKFADVLLDEVASLLEEPSLENLEKELQELNLLRYCKSALEKRRMM